MGSIINTWNKNKKNAKKSFEPITSFQKQRKRKKKVIEDIPPRKPFVNNYKLAVCIKGQKYTQRQRVKLTKNHT